MSSTHVQTMITLGDRPPMVVTFPLPQSPFAFVYIGTATITVHTADQAYTLIGALREASRFFEDADPGDLRTTTEAEADFQAQQARAEMATVSA